MSSPDRTRKCSISDIIDVINEEKLLIQNGGSLHNKDEGYDSNLSVGSLSSEENCLDDFEEKHNPIEEKLSDDECFINVENEQPDISDQNTKEDVNPQPKEIPVDKSQIGNVVLPAQLPKLLSGSNSNAIYVLLNTENKVQIVCASKEKLQDILQTQKNSTSTVSSTANTNINVPSNDTKQIDPPSTKEFNVNRQFYC